METVEEEDLSIREVVKPAILREGRNGTIVVRPAWVVVNRTPRKAKTQHELVGMEA